MFGQPPEPSPLDRGPSPSLECPRLSNGNQQSGCVLPQLFPPGDKQNSKLPSIQSPPPFSGDRNFMRSSQLRTSLKGSHFQAPNSVSLPFPFPLGKNHSQTVPRATGSPPLHILSEKERKELDNQHRTQQAKFGEVAKDQIILSELDHLLDLCAQEKNIIETYRSSLHTKTTKGGIESTESAKNFLSLTKAIAQKKQRAMGYILEGNDLILSNECRMDPPAPRNQFTLHINQQPTETAVANRYILPAPQLSISPSISAKYSKSTFVVWVSLAYHGNTSEAIQNTIDGKQEILQGIKRVTVDPTNHVMFTKVKIMEVSSKHRHQPFCLVFCLEEYKNDGTKQVHSSVKSAPFQVQSRPNKRKSTGSLPVAKRVCYDVHQQEVMLRKVVTSSLPNLSTIQNERDQREVPASENDQEHSLDYNYIDITDLLVLPQKEAARRLGISESMLCKRFKECTRRKWPYRYLRKINKLIAMLEMQQKDSPNLVDDALKLEKHLKEKEECLKPVRIRITSYDKMTNFSSSGSIPVDRPLLSKPSIELGHLVSQPSTQPAHLASQPSTQLSNQANTGPKPSGLPQIESKPSIQLHVPSFVPTASDNDAVETLQFLSSTVSVKREEPSSLLKREITSEEMST